MKKLVIIPTYNEKENILFIVNTVLSLTGAYDILVIDDGSPDGTAQIIKDNIPKHQGRLFLVLDIIDESFVLLIDVDLRKIQSPKKKKVKNFISKTTT